MPNLLPLQQSVSPQKVDEEWPNGISSSQQKVNESLSFAKFTFYTNEIYRYHPMNHLMPAGDPTQRFNCDTKYLFQICGLPWSATKIQIAEFFKNINILNSLDGILFIFDVEDKKNIRAYIQLKTLKDFLTALKMHKKCIGDRCIEGMLHY